jgi:hypothetical protein
VCKRPDQTKSDTHGFCILVTHHPPSYYFYCIFVLHNTDNKTETTDADDSAGSGASAVQPKWMLRDVRVLVLLLCWLLLFIAVCMCVQLPFFILFF